MELSLHTRLTLVKVSALDSQGQFTDFISSPDLTSQHPHALPWRPYISVLPAPQAPP